jgi:YVTN family beta-propeller protein
VVSAIGAVGPAQQPQKYAIAVSSPSATQNGLMTMVDFSGDTVLVTATLGVNPYYLALNVNGTTGYTLNSDRTVNSFDISTSLITSDVLQTTLLAGAQPVSIFPASAPTIYIADPGVNAVDQLYGAPPALKQELPVASGYSPVYVVGQSGAARDYIVSQATGGGAGEVSAIEASNNTISTTLPVGRGPVYGVMTVDDRRAFIMNQADNTVSVINTQTNELDTPVNTIPVGTRPVWADLASGLNELVVLNEGPVFTITGYSIASGVINISTAPQNLVAGQSVTLSGFPSSTFLNGQAVTVSSTGLSSNSFQATLAHSNVAATTEAGTGFTGDGTTTGTVSIVNIPLCSATALQTNPACDATNPVDATTFGNLVATVPVGVNPIMVSVLSDYSRAYVINAGVAGLPCATTAVKGVSTTCTVSVVNLNTDTVTATIPINGHPAWIATSNATPTGKVYVVCKDSQVMTVIETDTDSIHTTIPLQGYGISVRMTNP